MGQSASFRVEVAVDAPPEVVWAALTEVDQVRQWFGWEYDGLDAEIKEIFVDGAGRRPPDRIDLGPGHWIELESAHARTVVRAIGPASSADPQAYDEIGEGWRCFFEQLRYWLAAAPRGRRQMVRRSGTVPGQRGAAVLEVAEAKETWHRSRFQIMIIDAGGHLARVESNRPFDAAEPASVTLTVTTYGLSDAEFAAVEGEWAARWNAATA